MLAAVAFGLFIGMLAYAGLSATFSDERLVEKRLKGLTAYETTEVSTATPILIPFRLRVIRPLGAGLMRVAHSLAPAGYKDATSRKLAIAGNPRGMDFGRFFSMKLAIWLSVTALSVAGGVFLDASALGWFGIAAICVLSYWTADLWLTSACDSRRTAIRRALPDMLDMLTISVEAGLGFDQAVGKLVRNMRGPLAEELARALQRIQAGTDRSDALKQLATRCDVADLSTFVTAIVQAEVFGISIASVLRAQAREMRLKRRQDAEERAQKAPVKIVFPLVLCILPATMIVIMGPAVLRIARAFSMM